MLYSQYLTANGAIEAAGVPVRVYSIHVISGAAAGVTSLRNGSSVGATAFVTETGTALAGKTTIFGEGTHFPAGCFVSLDSGNTTSILVSYSRV